MAEDVLEAGRLALLVGLEALGMNLEDIFISIVDTSNAPARGAKKRTAKGYQSAEKSMAASILEKTAAKAQENGKEDK